ncbi:MAG: flagellar motor protein MotB [Alphaproteobacteria bacterium]
MANTKNTGNDDNVAPIIIKRVKKGHDAHHGGAWKVAYADFVTAMMAFFLLLWLLQVATQDQKMGIADYFSPASVTRSKSGAGGILSGRTMTKEGARVSEATPIGVMVALPPEEGESDAGETGVEVPSETKGEDTRDVIEDDDAATADANQERAKDAEELLAAREEEQFAQAAEALRQAIDNVPDLQGLINNLLIDRTSEGMRIQIIDEANQSMFPTGSAKMYDHTRQLLQLIVGAVQQLPQQIAIKGHTDAAPFVNDQGYSNWELSTDRANASRRALIEAGLTTERIASVVGLADKDHLDADDPLSPRNRRISIILLRETALPTNSGRSVQPQRASTK